MCDLDLILDKIKAMRESMKLRIADIDDSSIENYGAGYTNGLAAIQSFVMELKETNDK